MEYWWFYLLAAILITIAIFIARKNQRETGVSFWRSFFYSLLLIIGILALVLAAITGGKK